MAAQKEKLLGESDTIANEIRRLIFDEMRWETSKICSNYSIHRTSGSFANKSPCFKAEGMVNLSQNVMYDMVHPTETYRSQWDSMVDKCHMIDELDDENILCQTKVKSQLLGLISARDSIDVVRFENESNHCGISYGSVCVDEYQPETKYVRAWSYPSAVWFFKTDNENQSKFVVIFQANFNLTGLIPLSIQESATPRLMSKFIDNLTQNTVKIPHVPLNNCPGRRNICL